MDRNFAAWMIAGGRGGEDPHAARDREQLRAFEESRRAARHAQPSLISRIRLIVLPNGTVADPTCCPA
jgi:hypothetical protein